MSSSKSGLELSIVAMFLVSERAARRLARYAEWNVEGLFGSPLSSNAVVTRIVERSPAFNACSNATRCRSSRLGIGVKVNVVHRWMPSSPSYV